MLHKFTATGALLLQSLAAAGACCPGLPYSTAWVLEASHSSLFDVPTSQRGPQQQAQPQLGVQVAECLSAL